MNMMDAILHTEYVDSAHLHVEVAIPSPFADPDKSAFVVTEASNIEDFIVGSNGSLRTPEITIKAIVTIGQYQRLRDLYIVTNPPGYVDEDYPVKVSFYHGDYGSDSNRSNVSSEETHDYYLKELEGVDGLQYSNATISEVSLTLRRI